MDVVTLALAKKYVKSTLAGSGALQGSPGPPGPQGEPGPNIISTATQITGIADGKFISVSGGKMVGVDIQAAGVYTHTQSTPADVWNIQHNLGVWPVEALITDSSGDGIIGMPDLAASTGNLLIIRFSEPLTGKAFIKF